MRKPKDSVGSEVWPYVGVRGGGGEACVLAGGLVCTSVGDLGTRLWHRPPLPCCLWTGA